MIGACFFEFFIYVQLEFVHYIVCWVSRYGNLFLRYLKQVELKKAGKWILNIPAKAAGLGSVVGYPIINLVLKEKSEEEKKVPIYNKLVQGSRQPLIQQPMLHVIDRPDIMTDITNRFFSKPELVTRFGVVIGPSGSGKTYTIKDLCNKYPDGVL